MENPSDLIAFVRRLIKSTKHTPELESEHRNPTFLNELVNLGKTYAVINPGSDFDGEPIHSFLHTVWTAQNIQDVERGVAQFEQFVQGTEATVNPTQLLEFTSNLMTAAHRASADLGQSQNAAFFAELTALGQTYLRLNPLSSNDEYQPLNFFLDTLLKDLRDRSALHSQNTSTQDLQLLEHNAIQIAASELSPFLVSNNPAYQLDTSGQRTQLMAFAQNLVEMTARTPQLHPQKDNPKFLRDLLEFGKLYDALREELPVDAPHSFLYDLWKHREINPQTLTKAGNFFQELGTAIALEDTTTFALRLLAVDEHRATLPQPQNTAAPPNLAPQLAQLARAYAALNPEKTAVNVDSFLNTAWISDRPIDEIASPSLDFMQRAATELNTFLVGNAESAIKGFEPADQPKVLEFTTKLLKAAELTNQLAENQKTNPALLKSAFIDTSRNFAHLQLRNVQPEAGQSIFLHTLWNADVNDTAAIQQGVAEMETLLAQSGVSIESMEDIGKILLAIDLTIDKLDDEYPELVVEMIRNILLLIGFGAAVVALMKAPALAAIAGVIGLLGTLFDVVALVFTGNATVRQLIDFYTSIATATDADDIEDAADELAQAIKSGGEFVGAFFSLLTIGKSGWDEMAQTLKPVLRMLKAVINVPRKIIALARFKQKFLKFSGLRGLLKAEPNFLDLIMKLDEAPEMLDTLEKLLDNLKAANPESVEIESFFQFLTSAENTQLNKTVEAIRQLSLPDKAGVLQMLTPQNSGVIGAILKTDVGPDVVNDLGRLINAYGENSVETLIEHVKKMSRTGANQSEDIAFTLRGWAMRLGNVSLQEGAEILEGLAYALRKRNEMPSIGRTRNLGYGEFDEINIDGTPDGIKIAASRDELIAVSTPANPTGTLSTPLSPARILKTNPERESDSEYRILEDVARRIKEAGAQETDETEDGRKIYGNVIGTVTIFTERMPCPDCSRLISDIWTEQFPGVEIKVLHGPRFLPVSQSDLNNGENFTNVFR